MKGLSGGARRLHSPATPFGRLVLATGASRFGDAIRVFSVTLWIFARTGHSGPAVSGVLLAQTLPVIAVGILLGSFVDRRSRRQLLITGALGQATLTLALIVAVVFNQVLIALLLVAGGAGLDTLCTVVARSWVPFLVGPDDLDRSNAYWQMTEQIAFLLGPAAAAYAYSRAGAGPALIADGLTFVVLAALSATLPLQVARLVNVSSSEIFKSVPPEPSGEKRLSSRSGRLHDLKELLQQPGIAPMVTAASFAALTAGLNNTVMIFFVTEILLKRSELLAALPTVNGVTQLVAGGAVVRLSNRVSEAARLRVGASLLAAGGLIVALAPTLGVLVFGVVVTSFGNAPFNIGLMSCEQRLVPKTRLGEFRGMQEASGSAFFVLGSLFAGATVAFISPRELLLISFGACLVVYACIEVGQLRKQHVLVDRMTGSEARVSQGPELPEHQPHAI